MGCVRLPKGTAAGGQRRRRASSELSCVRKRHQDGELLDIRGGLDGVGEHEQPRIDHADAAGGAGGDLEVVGDVLPGRPAAPQLLTEPASCSARASLRACKGPFRGLFMGRTVHGSPKHQTAARPSRPRRSRIAWCSCEKMPSRCQTSTFFVPT